MASPLHPDRLRRARAYRAFGFRLSLASQMILVLVMLALHLGGAGVALRDALAAPPTFLGRSAVIGVTLAAGWLAALPLAYLHYRRERVEGLSVQRAASWLFDQAKSLAITVVLFGLPLAAWYASLQREDWWLLTVVGTSLVTAIAFALGPVLQALFFRFEPLDDRAVVERIRSLGVRARVPVAGVYRWRLSEKSTAGNAAVTGLGPTKRIIVADTLLARDTLDEVEAVVAHELGHQVHADMVRLLVVGAAALSALLLAARLALDSLASGGTVRGAADVGSFPLLAALLVAAGLALRPALMMYLRRREYAADAFGARFTSGVALASALVRLIDQNLGDPEPPAWEEALFMSHPSVRNRVLALGQPWPPRAEAASPA